MYRREWAEQSGDWLSEQGSVLVSTLVRGKAVLWYSQRVKENEQGEKGIKERG